MSPTRSEKKLKSASRSEKKTKSASCSEKKTKSASRSTRSASKPPTSSALPSADDILSQPPTGPASEGSIRHSTRFPRAGADFCVVSSDGIAFGFTSTQLLQSLVFSDMVNASTTKSDIHLIDNDIETSQSIHLLLQLLCGDRMDKDGSDVPSLAMWENTLLLAKKYDFAQAYMQGITCCYMIYKKTTASINMNPMILFRLAARLDEEDLARAAVLDMSTTPLPSESHVSPTDQDKRGQYVSYYGMHDFGAWPVDLIQALPTTYAWALARAAQPSVHLPPPPPSMSKRHKGDSQSDSYYSNDIPQRFKHFIALAKSESQWISGLMNAEGKPM